MMNFWVSWWLTESDGMFELRQPWWRSGENADGDVSICAAVRASSPDEVEPLIYGLYDVRPDHIEFRFIESMQDDWTPFNTRFRRANWMEW